MRGATARIWPFCRVLCSLTSTADAQKKARNAQEKGNDQRRASSEVAPEPFQGGRRPLAANLVAGLPSSREDLDELEGLAAKTMELYNKLVAIVTGWLDKLDASTLSTADGFTAFKLLAPAGRQSLAR